MMTSTMTMMIKKKKVKSQLVVINFNTTLQSMHTLFLFAIFVSGFAFASTAHAQSAPIIPPNVDPGEELEREQEEERRREEIENFDSRNDLGSKDSDQSTEGQTAAAEGPCIQIKEISVTGAGRIKSSIDNIKAPYAPDCMSRVDIAALMKKIDEAYIKLGLITSRAYIEKQDFKDGILKLKVIEGVVEDVVVIDGDGKPEPTLRRLTAFPISKGGVLQLRDFEQGLDQLNRLKSTKATLKLSPGENPGGTIVNVSVKDEHRYRASASWNNHGSPTTGKDQLRLSLGAENVFLANDIWGVTYVGTLDSNALVVSTSVPVGYATLNVSGVASDYLIGLTPTSELYGDSLTGEASMNYVFRRRAKHKSFAELGLQVRKSRRFVNSFELSPQTLATLRLTGGHIIEGKSAKISMDASYLYGTDWFGATEDPDDISDREANAQFHAFEFGITRVPKPKKWGRWIISARGKLSDEALYGPEQTPLGARSTVRGYRTAPLSADTAFYVRNDLMLSMDESWKDFAGRLPGGAEGPLGTLAASLQPYLFADMGVGYSRSQLTTDVVGGFGGGLRIKGKRVNFDIGGEIPIAKVEFREFNDPRFLATIGVNWP